MIAELAGATLAGRVVTIDYRLAARRDVRLGALPLGRTTARCVGDEIQCSSRDIGARRQAEAELAQRLAQQAAVAQLGELALQRGTSTRSRTPPRVATLDVDCPRRAPRRRLAVRARSAGEGFTARVRGRELPRRLASFADAPLSSTTS